MIGHAELPQPAKVAVAGSTSVARQVRGARSQKPAMFAFLSWCDCAWVLSYHKAKQGHGPGCDLHCLSNRHVMSLLLSTLFSLLVAEPVILSAKFGTRRWPPESGNIIFELRTLPFARHFLLCLTKAPTLNQRISLASKFALGVLTYCVWCCASCWKNGSLNNSISRGPAKSDQKATKF